MTLRFAFRIAKKIFSVVAGTGRHTGPPPPNAATASRMASRTEIASISGGSPTALLPNTTSGSAARSRKSTWKTAGNSDHDGNLYVDAPAGSGRPRPAPKQFPRGHPPNPPEETPFILSG